MQNYFTVDQGIILIRLILLHLINDFLVQPNSWVKHRNENHYKSSRLYAHGLIAGLAAYIAFWKWSAFPIFVVISSTHILIDLWKSHQVKDRSNLSSFLLYQFAHIFILVVCWLVWISGFGTLAAILKLFVTNYKIMLCLLGYD